MTLAEANAALLRAWEGWAFEDCDDHDDVVATAARIVGARLLREDDFERGSLPFGPPILREDALTRLPLGPTALDAIRKSRAATAGPTLPSGAPRERVDVECVRAVEAGFLDDALAEAIESLAAWKRGGYGDPSRVVDAFARVVALLRDAFGAPRGRVRQLTMTPELERLIRARAFEVNERREEPEVDWHLRPALDDLFRGKVRE